MDLHAQIIAPPFEHRKLRQWICDTGRGLLGRCEYCQRSLNTKAPMPGIDAWKQQLHVTSLRGTRTFAFEACFTATSPLGPKSWDGPTSGTSCVWEISISAKRATLLLRGNHAKRSSLVALILSRLSASFAAMGPTARHSHRSGKGGLGVT